MYRLTEAQIKMLAALIRWPYMPANGLRHYWHSLGVLEGGEFIEMFNNHYMLTSKGWSVLFEYYWNDR